MSPEVSIPSSVFNCASTVHGVIVLCFFFLSLVSGVCFSSGGVVGGQVCSKGDTWSLSVRSCVCVCVMTCVTHYRGVGGRRGVGNILKLFSFSRFWHNTKKEAKLLSSLAWWDQCKLTYLRRLKSRVCWPKVATNWCWHCQVGFFGTVFFYQISRFLRGRSAAVIWMRLAYVLVYCGYVASC